jgi:hypothetical protein
MLVLDLEFVLMLEWKLNPNRTGRLIRKSPLAPPEIERTEGISI